MGEGRFSSLAVNRVHVKMRNLFAFGWGVVIGTLGGLIGVVVNGTWMLVLATAVCGLTTAYTYFHQDRRVLLDQAPKRQRQRR